MMDYLILQSRITSAKAQTNLNLLEPEDIDVDEQSTIQGLNASYPLQ